MKEYISKCRVSGLEIWMGIANACEWNWLDAVIVTVKSAAMVELDVVSERRTPFVEPTGKDTVVWFKLAIGTLDMLGEIMVVRVMFPENPFMPDNARVTVLFEP